MTYVSRHLDMKIWAIRDKVIRRHLVCGETLRQGSLSLPDLCSMRSVKKIEERTKRIVSTATICVRPPGFQFHGRRPKGRYLGEAIAKKKGV